MNPDEKTMKWVLFCLMAATVPLIYFMFVVGGLLPLIAIMAMSFSGVWGFKAFNAVHLALYAPVLYWIAKILSRRLSSLSQRSKVVLFVGISIVLVASSFLPLYSLGHNESQSVNLYRLFNSGLLR